MTFSLRCNKLAEFDTTMAAGKNIAPTALEALLSLLDLEQRSTQEISRITGWTRAMVKMRAMRARLKLRQIARQQMKSEFTES